MQLERAEDDAARLHGALEAQEMQLAEEQGRAEQDKEDLRAQLLRSQASMDRTTRCASLLPPDPHRTPSVPLRFPTGLAPFPRAPVRA